MYCCCGSIVVVVLQWLAIVVWRSKGREGGCLFCWMWHGVLMRRKERSEGERVAEEAGRVRTPQTRTPMKVKVKKLWSLRMYPFGRA